MRVRLRHDDGSEHASHSGRSQRAGSVYNELTLTIVCAMRRVYRQWSSSYRHLLSLHADPALLAQTWAQAFAHVIGAQQQTVADRLRTLEAVRERLQQTKRMLAQKYGGVMTSTTGSGGGSGGGGGSRTPASNADRTSRALKYDNPTQSRTQRRSVLKTGATAKKQARGGATIQSARSSSAIAGAGGAGTHPQELSFNDSNTSMIQQSQMHRPKSGAVRRPSTTQQFETVGSGGSGSGDDALPPPPPPPPQPHPSNTTTTTSTTTHLDRKYDPPPQPQPQQSTIDSFPPPPTTSTSTTNTTTTTSSSTAANHNQNQNAPSTEALLAHIDKLTRELETRTQQCGTLSELNERLRERLELFRVRHVHRAVARCSFISFVFACVVMVCTETKRVECRTGRVRTRHRTRRDRCSAATRSAGRDRSRSSHHGSGTSYRRD